MSNENKNVTTSSVSGDLVNGQETNGRLINTTIIKVMVNERYTAEEINKLMAADLDYTKNMLELKREHADKHPDAIEYRKSKKFGRFQYLFLMAIVVVGFAAIVSGKATVLASSVIGVMLVMAVAAIALNGRERDDDSSILLKLLEKIIGNSK